MIKQHTARSLARYLGLKVKIIRIESPYLSWETTIQGIDLTGAVNCNSKTEVTGEDHISVAQLGIHIVYPILYSIKTLKNRPEDFGCFFKVQYSNYKECLQNDFSLYWSTGFGDESRRPDKVLLIEKSYGAIPNQETPTGYLDPFGYPCICRDEG